MKNINLIKTYVIMKVLAPILLAFYCVRIDNIHMAFFLPIICVGFAMDILYRNLDLLMD